MHTKAGLDRSNSYHAPSLSFSCFLPSRLSLSLSRGKRKPKKGGHLDILQWARSAGCPWSAKTCASAALGGHLHVLTWLRANGCPWSSSASERAAEGGHLDVLKWLDANGCSMSPFVCSDAAKVRRAYMFSLSLSFSIFSPCLRLCPSVSLLSCVCIHTANHAAVASARSRVHLRTS